MGDVYKARDTRLNRTVAIKVLPTHLAANPELRTRFEREARAVSSLDHPHICVLHDVGRVPSTDSGEGAEIDFLVMQFLEGETLAQRLTRGPLPLADALRHGVEIAGALDTAHRAGILHRDLKPGNVMLTSAGAKLMDFGLAKLALPASGQTVAATASAPLTERGSYLGTLLYMSPEQLEGGPVDARSDIFSFGAMLYEMLTGRRAFEGHSQASIIAAILEREPPPMTERAPLTPPALDRVVRKCLAKDPDHRWQSARDLGDELAWISQGNSSQSRMTSAPVAGARRSWVAPLAASVAVLALLATAAVVWTGRNRSAPTPTIARHLTVDVPANVRLAPGGIAVSPDGHSLVYTAAPVETTAGGVVASPRLYLQRSASDTAAAIAGTDGAVSPFFSPDGLWIGFFTATALMKVSVLGGAPIKITDTPPVSRGGTWGPNDTILFSPTQSSVIHRVSAAGEPGQPVTKAQEAQLWPQFLPGGRAVIFTKRLGTARNLDNADLMILDLTSGRERMLVQGGAYGQYSPSGHILFTRGETLYALSFDVAKGEATGTPLPVVDGLALNPLTGSAGAGAPQFAVAPDASLYVIRGGFPDTTTVATWVDRSGAVVGRPLPSGRSIWGPRLSPDGRRAVVTSATTQGDADIFMLDVASGSMVRFSGDAADDFNAVWDPAGKTVIYSSFAIARLPTLVSKPADSGGRAEPLVQTEGPQFTGSVSPSGLLAFTTFRPGTRSDLYTVALTGDRTPRPFLSTSADEFGPEFSPDGNWLAYSSTEAGGLDVYVAPFPGPGPPRRISTNGGFSPAWCRSCGELFYQTPAGMMAVSVNGDAFGVPRLLFAAGLYRSASREDGPRQYDVTPDGKQFLMLRAETVNADSTARLDVIIDWVSRLNQRTKSGG